MPRLNPPRLICYNFILMSPEYNFYIRAKLGSHREAGELFETISELPGVEAVHVQWGKDPLQTESSYALAPVFQGLSRGQLIREARIGMGLTQRALADRIGISNSRLSAIELGRPSSLGTLMRIAEELGIPEEDSRREQILAGARLSRTRIR